MRVGSRQTPFLTRVKTWDSGMRRRAVIQLVGAASLAVLLTTALIFRPNVQHVPGLTGERHSERRGAEATIPEEAETNDPGTSSSQDQQAREVQEQRQEEGKIGRGEERKVGKDEEGNLGGQQASGEAQPKSEGEGKERVRNSEEGQNVEQQQGGKEQQAEQEGHAEQKVAPEATQSAEGQAEGKIEGKPEEPMVAPGETQNSKGQAEGRTEGQGEEARVAQEQTQNGGGEQQQQHEQSHGQQNQEQDRKDEEQKEARREGDRQKEGMQKSDGDNLLHFEQHQKHKNKLLSLLKSRMHRFDVPLRLLPPEALHWRHFFDTILLLVSFDSRTTSKKGPAHRSVVKFLQSLYGRVFSRMLFFSHRPSLELGIIRADPEAKGSEAHAHFNYAGLTRFTSFLHQQPMPLRAAVHDSWQGILWMDGDVLLNYWELTQADKTKIWIPRSLLSSSAWTWVPLPTTSADTDSISGDVLNEQYQLHAVSKCWQRNWPNWAKDNYKANTGGGEPLQVAKGPLPLFFMPKAVLFRLAPLIQALRSEGVTSEYALPLLILSAGGSHEQDPILQSFVDMQVWDPVATASKYNTSVCGLRPWDYSDMKHRGMLFDMVSKGDKSLERMALRWAKHEAHFERRHKHFMHLPRA